MKIFEVKVDKRPTECMFCPLEAAAVKITKPQCGEMKTRDVGDGWARTSKVPDHRCILKEVNNNANA